MRLINMFLVSAAAAFLLLGCGPKPIDVQTDAKVEMVKPDQCECQTTKEVDYDCECDPCNCADKK